MPLRVLALIAALVAATPGAARAEDRPWAVGVSEADQKRAGDLYKAGNERFVNDEWKAALELYLDALTSWDNPNIHYNAAICLIKLDRMVEAYTHMKAALRFGEAPLGKELYGRGRDYMRLLETSVAQLEIVCKAPAGARVSLDGQVLFEDCPQAPQERLVAAGKHQLVSEKRGYRTETRELELRGGSRETVVIVMQVEGTRKLTRRWAKWKPWGVVAGGLVVSAIAAPLWFVTDGKYDRYDEDVANTCRPKGGCPPGDPELAVHDDTLSSARLYRTLTYSTIAVGATGLAVGFVMVLMNQPRLGPVVVTPSVGRDRAGAMISIDW